MEDSAVMEQLRQANQEIQKFSQQREMMEVRLQITLIHPIT
jgi:hypothetical protein